jgi:hypothetical protein
MALDLIDWRSIFLVKHDLFGKPVSTFPDHALGARWAADRLRAHGFSPVK